MVNFQKSWYILYAKPKLERKVTELLTKRKVEFYFPLNQTTRQYQEKKKGSAEPLFSSFVFVYIGIEELKMVTMLPGVHNIVHWLGLPAIVREEEIKAIRIFLAEFGAVQIEKTKVALEKEVTITQGAVMHKEGKVVQINNNAVRLELPSLGYALTAISTSSRAVNKLSEIQVSNLSPVDYQINNFRIANY